MASPLPSGPSASELRRIRGAATKHKLYEASQQPNGFSMVCSQLAILTSTVDTLISVISQMPRWQVCDAVAAGCMSKLNARAPEFAPANEPEQHADGDTSITGSEGRVNEADTAPCEDPVLNFKLQEQLQRCDQVVDEFLDCHFTDGGPGSGLDCYSTHPQVMVERFKDEDIPQFSAEHMHARIQEVA